MPLCHCNFDTRHCPPRVLPILCLPVHQQEHSLIGMPVSRKRTTTVAAALPAAGTRHTAQAQLQACRGRFRHCAVKVLAAQARVPSAVRCIPAVGSGTQHLHHHVPKEEQQQQRTSLPRQTASFSTAAAVLPTPQQHPSVCAACALPAANQALVHCLSAWCCPSVGACCCCCCSRSTRF